MGKVGCYPSTELHGPYGVPRGWGGCGFYPKELTLVRCVRARCMPMPQQGELQLNDILRQKVNGIVRVSR